MTFGSLFAGIGGIDLGLERAEMQCAWQVENDPYAIRVLEQHWPDVRRWGDVATFPPDANGLRFDTGRAKQPLSRVGMDGKASSWQVDLIAGGFPCQPVSCAGKRAGESDERWLWDEFRRVCEVLQPSWVLAENVPGLLSARDVRGRRGALFGRVLRDLAALGYRVRWDCIPAAAVGAPHIRDRVFIIGMGRHTPRNGSEPKPRFQERPNTIARGACEETDWWSTEPDVGRVANGIPARVDRLRCLGNAVVPQVAEWIGRQIMAQYEPRGDA